MSNRLTIAGAGTGKTTFLINRALDLKNKQILITTYTEANELEIKEKFIKINGYIPSNITIQTYYSFLLQHGVKPYQGEMFDIFYDEDINGMLLVNSESGVVKKEGEVIYRYAQDHIHYYVNNNFKMFSDKISKFIFECNKKSNGKIIQRLSKIFNYIFIDEVQDLVGHDLELIKLLFKSDVNIELVGDPRQVTYSTHKERKNKKYSNGKIKNFIEDLPKKIERTIDESTLSKSHRNNQLICEYANKLYLSYPEVLPCECCNIDRIPSEHEGIFLVDKKDIKKYLERYNPVQLRWSSTTKVDENYRRMNLGNSKGLTFDRVLIYPTKKMIDWMKDNNFKLNDAARAKFYVGITRAKYSVGIIVDDRVEYDGVSFYNV